MHIARGELALSQFKFVLHHEIGSDSERKKYISVVSPDLTL